MRRSISGGESRDHHTRTPSLRAACIRRLAASEGDRTTTANVPKCPICEGGTGTFVILLPGRAGWAGETVYRSPGMEAKERSENPQRRDYAVLRRGEFSLRPRRSSLGRLVPNVHQSQSHISIAPRHHTSHTPLHSVLAPLRILRALMSVPTIIRQVISSDKP